MTFSWKHAALLLIVAALFFMLGRISAPYSIQRINQTTPTPTFPDTHQEVPIRMATQAPDPIIECHLASDCPIPMVECDPSDPTTCVNVDCINAKCEYSVQ